MVFPVIMYSCESSTVKKAECQRNWCLRTLVLEKTPESPLDNKEIKPVNLKGDQPWILIGMTDAEAETPVLWSFYVNSWLVGKVPGADRGQKEKASDEIAGWHHQYNGHELGQTSGGGEGQRGLVCCFSMGSQWVGHGWATEQQLASLPRSE